MKRREFLEMAGISGGAIFVSSITGIVGAYAQDSETPMRFGDLKLGVVREAGDARVIAMDSLLQIYDPLVTPKDVVIAGSYCGAANLPHAIRQGVRGFIAHDAGVGLDQAGIGALPLGDTHGIPVAAVENMSAEVSNGRSMAEQGIISHANEIATALGVKAGMNATDAAALMLSAPIRTPSEVELPLNHNIREMLTAGSGRGYASSAATNFPEGDEHARDVLAWGAHMGAIAAPILQTRRFKGCIGNDCGKARNDTGIASLPMLNEMGILAASVASMSARIGDGQSTWQDGRISAMNDLAAAAGITLDMPAAEAARLMLLA